MTGTELAGNQLPRCPCGDLHELSAAVRGAYDAVTSGLDNCVTVRIEGNRAWKVPRIYIAVHGLKTAELPGLAAQYGFEETADA